MSNEYAGWTNYQTWYVASVLHDALLESLYGIRTPDDVAIWFEDLLEKEEGIDPVKRPIAYDILCDFMGEVDWDQLYAAVPRIIAKLEEERRFSFAVLTTRLTRRS